MTLLFFTVFPCAAAEQNDEQCLVGDEYIRDLVDEQELANGIKNIISSNNDYEIKTFLQDIHKSWRNINEEVSKKTEVRLFFALLQASGKIKKTLADIQKNTIQKLIECMSSFSKQDYFIYKSNRRDMKKLSVYIKILNNILQLQDEIEPINNADELEKNYQWYKGVLKQASKKDNVNNIDDDLGEFVQQKFLDLTSKEFFENFPQKESKYKTLAESLKELIENKAKYKIFNMSNKYSHMQHRIFEDKVNEVVHNFYFGLKTYDAWKKEIADTDKDVNNIILTFSDLEKKAMQEPKSVIYGLIELTQSISFKILAIENKHFPKYFAYKELLKSYFKEAGKLKSNIYKTFSIQHQQNSNQIYLKN